MKNLQLSLKTKWFEMTKAYIKTEDYRDINEYWVKRFIYYKESKLTVEEIIRFIKNYKHYGYVDVSAIFTYHDLSFKEFKQNIMTLGYPKSTDKDINITRTIYFNIINYPTLLFHIINRVFSSTSSTI